jgi:glutathione S-transferase
MNYEAAVNAVIALALVEYLVFGTLVGTARGKFNVPAPATAGNPVWERMFRAHQNTLEQLIIFVPSMFTFGTFVSAPIACALGLVFIVGRALYFRGYTAEAQKRGPGFLIGALANIALLLGSLIGAGMKALG